MSAKIVLAIIFLAFVTIIVSHIQAGIIQDQRIVIEKESNTVLKLSAIIAEQNKQAP
jgi:hypothetical protein